MRNGLCIAVAVIAGLAGCDADLDLLCDRCPVNPSDHGSEVTLRAFVRHHSASGVVEVPIDLSKEHLKLLPAPSFDFDTDGGSPPQFSGAPGEGKFTEVPQGRYQLQWDFDFVLTNVAEVDLSYDQLGRADVRYVEAGAVLSITVDGGLPPGAYQLSSPNSGYIGFDLEDAIVSGTNRIALDYVDAWGGTRAPAIQSSQGDTTWLTHLRPGTLEGGISYRALRRAGELSAFEMTGGTVETGTEFTEHSGERFDFDWDRGEWDSVRTAVNPAATLVTANLYLDVLPFTGEAGRYASTADLVVVELSGGDAGSGSISYGNPFPNDWPVYSDAVLRYSVTQGGTTVNARVRVISNQRGGRYELPLTPPRAVKVNFLDGYQPQRVSEPLVLSWAPPKVGQPSYYRVDARAVTGAGTIHFARLYSSIPRVFVPNGLLGSGSYIFVITAVSEPDRDILRAPFLRSLPHAEAQTVSGMMTVP